MVDIESQSFQYNSNMQHLHAQDELNDIFQLHKAIFIKSQTSENKQVRGRYSSCGRKKCRATSNMACQRNGQKLKSLEVKTYERGEKQYIEKIEEGEKNDLKILKYQPLKVESILKKIIGANSKSKFEEAQLSQSKQQCSLTQQRYQRAICLSKKSELNEIFQEFDSLVSSNSHHLPHPNKIDTKDQLDSKAFQSQGGDLFMEEIKIRHSIGSFKNRIRNKVRNVIDLEKLQEYTNKHCQFSSFQKETESLNTRNQIINHQLVNNQSKNLSISQSKPQRRDSINSDVDEILPAKYFRDGILLTENTPSNNLPRLKPSSLPLENANESITEPSSNLLEWTKEQNNDEIKFTHRSRKYSNNKNSIHNQFTAAHKLESIPQQISYLSLLPPQEVSAKSWCIVNFEKRKMIEGKLCFIEREIASLTKLMTYCVCTHFFNQINLETTEIHFKINLIYTQIKGTSANLMPNTWMNVDNLLHGLLIPSGNDCAEILADKIGALIAMHKEGKELPNERNELEKQMNPFIKSGRKYFIEYMNYLAKFIKMKNSYFTNPTGLSNSRNQSTAYDIGMLSSLCMEFPEFRSIVLKKHFYATCWNEDGKNLSILWNNTNILLQKGFSGIKTGTTNTAGPCLSSFIKLKDSQTGLKGQFIIVLLDCSSCEQRWEDSMILAKWALKQLQFQ